MNFHSVPRAYYPTGFLIYIIWYPGELQYERIGDVTNIPVTFFMRISPPPCPPPPAPVWNQAILA